LLLVRLAPEEDAHDVDAGNDSAVLALRPSHEGKDAARRETDDAAATVDDLLVALAAEAYPVLDLAFLEGQLDQCCEGRRPVRQRTAVRAAMGATGHCSSPVMCWGLRGQRVGRGRHGLPLRAEPAPRFACARVKE